MTSSISSAMHDCRLVNRMSGRFSSRQTTLCYDSLAYQANQELFVRSLSHPVSPGKEEWFALIDSSSLVLENTTLVDVFICFFVFRIEDSLPSLSVALPPMCGLGSCHIVCSCFLLVFTLVWSHSVWEWIRPHVHWDFVHCFQCTPQLPVA